MGIELSVLASTNKFETRPLRWQSDAVMSRSVGF